MAKKTKSGKKAKPAARKPAPKKVKKAAPAPAAKPAAKLTAARIEQFRKALIAEQTRLRSRLGMREEDAAGDESSNVLDVTDMATQQEEREITRGIRIAEAEQLAAIDAALERIEDGSFGKCAKCGGPIEMPRLEALPHAQTCIVCRRSEERSRR